MKKDNYTLLKETIIKKLTHFENDLHIRFYADKDIDARKRFIQKWIDKNLKP